MGRVNLVLRPLCPSKPPSEILARPCWQGRGRSRPRGEAAAPRAPTRKASGCRWRTGLMACLSDARRQLCGGTTASLPSNAMRSMAFPGGERFSKNNFSQEPPRGGEIYPSQRQENCLQTLRRASLRLKPWRQRSIRSQRTSPPPEAAPRRRPGGEPGPAPCPHPYHPLPDWAPHRGGLAGTLAGGGARRILRLPQLRPPLEQEPGHCTHVGASTSPGKRLRLG